MTARAYQHGDMAKVCRRFFTGYGALPQDLQPFFPSRTVSPELVRIAGAFLKLQEARHEADYNLDLQYTREETMNLVELATEAFTAWEAIRRTDGARLFLLALTFEGRWAR